MATLQIDGAANGLWLGDCIEMSDGYSFFEHAKVWYGEIPS
jgi:hypothetical protein